MESNKIKALRKIVAEKQMGKVDGKRIDLYSASQILAVYDKLSPENQKKFEEKHVFVMANIAYQMCK